MTENINLTKKPIISLIAAISEQTRAIGKSNQLLWQLPEDLKHFKEITSGHPVIMGLNTFKSIGRLLPNRTNIILARAEENFIPPEGVLLANNIDEAVALASEKDSSEIFFIGGGQVYKMSIELADRLYLTLVNDPADGDTYFPDFSAFTKKISDVPGQSGNISYRFVVLEK